MCCCSTAVQYWKYCTRENADPLSCEGDKQRQSARVDMPHQEPSLASVAISWVPMMKFNHVVSPSRRSRAPRAL